jgi:ABC-type sugar transport system ATPase subunit
VAGITLRRVAKRFSTGHAAVDDLSLDIADGELLVLVGPSGSGRDVTDLPPQGRDLAMVFQSYALYPHKSVRENLAFGLRMRGVAPEAIEARVSRAAASLGIESLLGRRPAELSGGQRQRVALGRAIVREPQAFLLDEPLSNLDPLLRSGTRAELALLHRRLAATMVYVTHDQEEAMTLGTRIAVMNEGRLEQVGAPLELYDRPCTVFVARFIGAPAMNLWNAERDGAVLVGVRPHDITVGEPGSGVLDGTVEVVEPLGAQTIVHIAVTGRELMRVVVPANHRASAGDRVGLSWPPGSEHVFDAATRRRR